MKIVISGSSGLVGTALTRSLQSAGHKTFRLVRGAGKISSVQAVGSASRQANERAGASEEILWDPKGGLVVPKQLEGIDAVVHLAGRSIASARWTDDEKRLIRDSRVAATTKLAEQLSQLDRPPPIVVSASAIGIYGDTGDTIVSESSVVGSGFLASVAKDWEAATGPLSQREVRVVQARFGIVLSSEGGALSKVTPLFRWMLGGRLGSGKQYWSWVALEDCVRAIIWMLETDAAVGAYNVVAPAPVTNAEFTQQLAAVLNRPVGPPAPKFALRLAMGEMADALLLCSCRATPDRLQAEGFQFKYADLQSFLRAELLPG